MPLFDGHKYFLYIWLIWLYISHPTTILVQVVQATSTILMISVFSIAGFILEVVMLVVVAAVLSVTVYRYRSCPSVVLFMPRVSCPFLFFLLYLAIWCVPFHVIPYSSYYTFRYVSPHPGTWHTLMFVHTFTLLSPTQLNSSSFQFLYINFFSAATFFFTSSVFIVYCQFFLFRLFIF